MTRLHYNVDGEEVEIAMEMIPIHLAENFAASFAVVSALKLDIEPAASAICLYKTVLGRGNLVELNKEGKSYKIICDYYNSNPQSLKASLEYLAQMGDDNKIAILGDMGELGKKSASLHQQMVPYIKDSGISKLFLVGAAMAKLKNDFAKDIMVECYPDVDKLIAEIDQYIQGGELILIKGSKSMNLYKLAQHLGVCNVL